ncbi:MAG: hypothetical protein ACR2OH_00335 [Microthrixaceae bacterium]
MAGLPDEIANRSWRAERALPMADALDALLTHLESEEDPSTRVVRARRPSAPDPELPLSTGILEVDRALGGGLPQRRLTLLEADLPAQAHALLWSIARTIAHPTVLDVDSPLGAVAWIWAGGAGVPAISMTQRRMTSAEWERATGTIGELANRVVSVGSAESVHGLAAMVATQRVRVVLVQDIERFGDAPDVVQALAGLAVSAQLSIMATSGAGRGASGDAPGEAKELRRRDVHLVQVLSSDFGGTARMVRTDHIDMLAVNDVRMDLLTGRVG